VTHLSCSCSRERNLTHRAAISHNLSRAARSLAGLACAKCGSTRGDLTNIACRTPSRRKPVTWHRTEGRQRVTRG